MRTDAIEAVLLVWAWLAARWRRARAAIVAGARASWAVRAELLQAGALLGGWTLLTFVAATLWRPIAWAASAGVLLLLLCGWRWLWGFFRDGLYSLTREAE